MSKQSGSGTAHGNFPSPASRPGLRRLAREAALQCLFQLEVQGFEENSIDPLFWRLRATSPEEDAPQESVDPPLPPKARTFAETLVRGVCAERAQIDALLTRFASNFSLHRLAAVDRNILRLAVYELLHPAEAPHPVVINEAIEIAKRFGTEDSGRFVNGLLDRIRLEIRSGPKAPAPAPASPLPLGADPAVNPAVHPVAEFPPLPGSSSAPC